MNECGLLEIPEAGDWMDLLAVRYNTLYDNALYYGAALAHQQLARHLGECVAAHALVVDAAGIHDRLNSLMWVDRCWVAEHFAEHLERLKAFRLEWFLLYHNIGTISSRPFYLPWVAFREYGDWCDSLGNLLAILTGLADGHAPSTSCAICSRSAWPSHTQPKRSTRRSTLARAIGANIIAAAT